MEDLYNRLLRSSEPSDHIRAEVVNTILQQRIVQDDIIDDPDHDMPIWMALLGEKIGAANRAVLEEIFGMGNPVEERKKLIESITAVAAEAFAIAEFLAANTCRVCGCHWFAPCEGGCSWAEPGLCSACTPEAIAARAEDLKDAGLEAEASS